MWFLICFIFVFRVQLEQTQKTLDHVKQSYIDVCAAKEQMMNEHKLEMKLLKEKYEHFELKEQLLEKRELELSKQLKLVAKLSNDCEKYRNKIIELEKDVELERRKRTEHARMTHIEIEKGNTRNSKNFIFYLFQTTTKF